MKNYLEIKFNDRNQVDDKSTKENYLEIKSNDRNQVDGKIVCGLGEEFLSFH